MRDRPKTPEVQSPVRISKAKSAKHNTVIVTSPSKVNYSFTSETKSAKRLYEKELNNSTISQMSNSNEKKKNPTINRLSKDMKHTSSNPNLSSLNPMHKSKSTIEKVAAQYSSTKLKSSPEAREDSARLKLMQFDFDDEEDFSPKPGTTYFNPNLLMNFKEEKLDISSLEGINRCIEYQHIFSYIYWNRQFPLNREFIEDKLPTILSTLLIHPSTQNIIAFEHSLEVLKKVLALPINLKPHLEQIICGITSLYHSPLKVKI